jgi:hypothetical protein
MYCGEEVRPVGDDYIDFCRNCERIVEGQTKEIEEEEDA